MFCLVKISKKASVSEAKNSTFENILSKLFTHFNSKAVRIENTLLSTFSLSLPPVGGDFLNYKYYELQRNIN